MLYWKHNDQEHVEFKRQVLAQMEEMLLLEMVH